MTVGGFCVLHLIQARHAIGQIPDSTFSFWRIMGCCSEMSGLSHVSTGQPDGKCIATAAALIAGGALIGYFVGYKLATKRARVNNCIQLGCSKVVDTVDVEDIGEKKVFCRCWKSEKWPYCDGSHVKHNKETGDNVAPLIVKSEKKQ
ncbi:unnamed protein product [Caenorhabditis auriculariae]|uniref:CDGSH iron-sulfur domain-containing protein 2 homologue n=1 Tax=Caenorhabditis auriculariae TaxID=2777116 RepID=A0A8S1HSQ4_9PELO|nr:unnamed protein product [Caenorhabditis auriculariae]